MQASPEQPSRPAADSLSTGELISQLTTQVSTLVRDELALARIELTEKGKKAGVGVGMFGGAGVLALYGVGALIATAIAALALVLPVWAAALIVAVVLFLVAGIVALVGKKNLAKAAPPVPTEAVEGAKLDVQTLKEHAHR